MSAYILTDFEKNGYDDSDFLCAYFDAESGTLGVTCYGSTRYPSAHSIAIKDGVTSVTVNGKALIMPTAEIVEKARLALAAHIADNTLRAMQSPSVAMLRHGAKAYLTRACKMRAFTSAPCGKCSGSGHWVNPRNAADKRDCFACSATGAIETKTAGWIKLEKGLVGTIVSVSEYRGSVTVTMVDEHGTRFRASLEALSMVVDAAAIAQDADARSHDLEFSKIHPRHAWDTSNYARAVKA